MLCLLLNRPLKLGRAPTSQTLPREKMQHFREVGGVEVKVKEIEEGVAGVEVVVGVMVKHKILSMEPKLVLIPNLLLLILWPRMDRNGFL